LYKIESLVAAPDFWADARRAGEILQEAAGLKDELGLYHKLREDLEELEVLLELAEESEDPEIEGELQEGIKKFNAALNRWEEETLFRGPYDHRNALISLHAGAGVK